MSIDKKPVIKSNSINPPKKFSLMNDLIEPTIVAIPIIGIGFGILGDFSKWGCSFFNPSFASTCGSFSTFLGVGALAAPLIIIPALITDHLLEKSPFLQRHLFMKRFLESSLGIIYAIGAVAVSAALIGSPIIPTMVPMLLLPVMLWALINVVNAVQAFTAYLKEDTSAVPVL